MRAFRLLPAHGFGFASGASALLLLPDLPSPAFRAALICIALALQWQLMRARIHTGIASSGLVFRVVLPFSIALLLALSYASWRAELRFADRLDAKLQGVELSVQGSVLGLPTRDGRAIRFDLALESGAIDLPQRVRVSWYETQVAVHPGQCLALVLRLKRPRGLVNPAGFDFERYALAGNIGATGYVVRRDSVSATCTRRAAIDALRARIASGFDAVLAPGRIRATAKALAIGDTRELDEQAWDLYRATGTSHLIAISGMHVGLAAALGGGLLWLWYALFPGCGLRIPRPQAMAIAALLTALLYAALAGFSLPTQRTVITITAMLAGVLTRRELGWWTRYSLALVGVLLLDPLAPLTVGFWLSFAAVAWLILAFASTWKRQATWRVLLLPQLGLSIALLPLGLAFFQQTSLMAPLVNLIAVPYVTFLVVPVLLAALVFWPLASASAALLHLAAWLLGAFDALIVISAQWPAARWALPAPSVTVWLLALLGTAWLLAPRGWPGRVFGAVALLPLFLPRSDPPGPGAFALTVLDVGQGQSVLVRTQGHALLIDTGPGFPEGGDLGDRVLLPSLVQLGVFRLDRLIVSHDDLDHAGGTASLRRRMPIDRIDTSAPQSIEGSGACLAGESWVWDAVQFEILHPPPTLPYLGNESSCVLRIVGIGGSVLIPGDIGEVIEDRLRRERSEHLDSDVLIAGHHGSAGSSSAAFLRAVSPDVVLYSAGYRNRFNFPRPEVVERVRAIGAAQYNSADRGAIEVVFQAGLPPRVRSQRLSQPRWWMEPIGAIPETAVRP